MFALLASDEPCLRAVSAAVGVWPGGGVGGGGWDGEAGGCLIRAGDCGSVVAGTRVGAMATELVFGEEAVAGALTGVDEAAGVDAPAHAWSECQGRSDVWTLNSMGVAQSLSSVWNSKVHCTVGSIVRLGHHILHMNHPYS